MTTSNSSDADNHDTEDIGWREIYENQGRPLTVGTLLDGLLTREQAVRDLPVAVELYDGTDQRKPLAVMFVSIAGTTKTKQTVTFTVSATGGP